MPRIHEPAAHALYNHYDAIRFSRHDNKICLKDGRIRLFGIQNLGQPVFCSLDTPSALPMASDKTTYVKRWWARTNIPESTPGMTDWLHASRAHLVVGDQPVRSKSLWELVTHTPEEPLASQDHYDTTYNEQIAKKASEYAASVYARELGASANSGGMWENASEAQQVSWRETIRMLRAEFGVDSLVIIPVRQTFSVIVHSDKRAYAKLAEMMPKTIAPEPALWVHLDGFMRRDVC